MSLRELQEQLRLAIESADRERQRANDAIMERNMADRRAEEYMQYTRKTTLTEYLDYCHIHLFQPISVQTDKSLTTQGDITSPKGKLRPNRLRPWKDFLANQKNTQERLQSAYIDHDNQRALENLAFIEGLGKRVASRKLASERDLAHLQRETIETPVASIIDHLQTVDSVQGEFNIGNGIFFDNHANSLSDTDEEVSQRLRNLQPFTPNHSRPPPVSGIRADQICVYTATQEQGTLRKLAFVVEYKAPHKLTPASLRLGLREMDVKSIVDRDSVPPAKIEGVNNPEHFQYHADRLVASAITQTFSYMIHGGTQYAYITTGEAFVFLHVRLDDPSTIYYHLAEPGNDVIAQKAAGKEYVHRTAVSQVLAFSLLALESPSGNQRWRENAVNMLDTWEVDYEAILRSMSDSVRTTPPTSDYHPNTYTPIGRLTMRLRTRKPRDTCHPSSVPFDDDDNDKDRDSPGSSDHEPPPDTPSRPVNCKRYNRNAEVRSRGANTFEPRTQSRPFCTQLCLYGLARRGPLDPVCPNVLEHRGTKHNSNEHRINCQTFLTLLHQQLRQDRDRDCRPLGIQGARGALFKVTLTSYGYTVVAKGTVAAFVQDLQHESRVYRRLRPVQGVCVPICLGSIDLVHPYYYEIGVLIVHMMILSWAGERLDKSEAVKDVDQKVLSTMVTQSIERIHHAGILHADLRIANILWNAEIRRVILIDFERAELMKGSERQALAPISSNQKRKRFSLDEQALGKKDNGDVTVSESQMKLRFMNELFMAQREVAQQVE
ncbi:hypothetical protein MFRU_090g00020 [Monilinia fructicola]|nr:hypothetical protein MFRU_090g00020 [Monilinia fructicola]